MLGYLAAVLALSPATTGAPVAMAPSEPAPTNVTLAWTSDARTEAVITWDEAGDARTRLELIGGGGISMQPKFVEAGRPNRTPMWGGLFGANFRVRVTVVDADGNALSEPADSPEFDTDQDPAAVVTSVVPRADGTILMTWKPGEYTDPNPGDPLDTPVVPVRYIPVASQPVYTDYDHLAEPTTATSFVIPKRPTPLAVGLRTAPNGWFGYTGVSVPVDGGRLTVKARTGAKLTVTGKAIKLTRACDLSACEAFVWDNPDRRLTLQRRAGATWTTVATTVSRADGTYTFTTARAGAGAYRVLAPPTARVTGQAAQGIVISDVVTVAAGGGPTASPTPSASPAPTAAPAPGTGSDGGSGGGGSLPITGTPVMWVALAGGLLVLLGVVFATLGRARRRS
ncbi:hypothetical protein [Actinoplanes sp. M2I2]|uniref:hypothetical protein n=1 Tax=Actinoplanes sp. M2I2 TaxID=1734444 RepID=UPI002021769E|nr:hypothetical protein [Actinoplanes sp. M2I2]